jgi:hypothetical protein
VDADAELKKLLKEVVLLADPEVPEVLEVPEVPEVLEA